MKRTQLGLGFRALPAGYFGGLIAMTAAYLILVEFGKVEFFRPWRRAHPRPPATSNSPARRLY